MNLHLTKQVNTRFPTGVATALNEAAARELMSPGAFVRRLVIRELRIDMEPRRSEQRQNAA